MTPVLIGIISALVFIVLFHMLTHFDKALGYGLILTGIATMYVWFTMGLYILRIRNRKVKTNLVQPAFVPSDIIYRL